jgi:hypothetical protein
VVGIIDSLVGLIRLLVRVGRSGYHDRKVLGMATIWKRKDRDVWIVDLRDASGKRVREVGGTTRAEAESKLAQRIKESQEYSSEVVDGDILLKDYARRWLASVTDQLAQRTIRSYRQLLDLHILPELGSMKVREFRRRDVKRLLAEKRKALGKNTVRLIKAALSTVLSQAVEEEIIAVNPALGRFRESRMSQSARQADVNPMSMTNWLVSNTRFRAW